MLGGEGLLSVGTEEVLGEPEVVAFTNKGKEILNLNPYMGLFWCVLALGHMWAGPRTYSIIHAEVAF